MTPHRLDENAIASLRKCLGARIGPAHAADLGVRLADGRVVLVARSLTIDVRSHGEGAATRLTFAVADAIVPDVLRSLHIHTADDLGSGALVDFVLGPIDRVAVLADASGTADVAVQIEGCERPWITERTTDGTTISRRGEPRRVRLLVAIEASHEARLWISRDETRIDELVAGYALVERVVLTGT